jgi:hypothetical protein
LFTNVPSGIRVEIENKTDEDLVVDWANTLYISNGATDGNFVFDGRPLSTQMSSPKVPDVAFPKRKLSKVIKPSSSVSEYLIPSLGRQSFPSQPVWFSHPLKPGEHGVYLSLKLGDKELKETLAFVLKHERIVEEDSPPAVSDKP